MEGGLGRGEVEVGEERGEAGAEEERVASGEEDELDALEEDGGRLVGGGGEEGVERDVERGQAVGGDAAAEQRGVEETVKVAEYGDRQRTAGSLMRRREQRGDGGDEEVRIGVEINELGREDHVKGPSFGRQRSGSRCGPFQGRESDGRVHAAARGCGGDVAAGEMEVLAVGEEQAACKVGGEHAHEAAAASELDRRGAVELAAERF